MLYISRQINTSSKGREEKQELQTTIQTQYFLTINCNKVLVNSKHFER